LERDLCLSLASFFSLSAEASFERPRSLRNGVRSFEAVEALDRLEWRLERREERRESPSVSREESEEVEDEELDDDDETERARRRRDRCRDGLSLELELDDELVSLSSGLRGGDDLADFGGLI
jgi:hypothetical protein